MSLKHLRAMRDYGPPRKKDQMATTFLWILAERAQSGAKLKNGHQTVEGETGFLPDEKLMAQLGIERQVTLRDLRRRFRKARAITTDRKHTGKSKWPVYRYNLSLEWLVNHGIERSTSKTSNVESSLEQTDNVRNQAENERSTLTYSGLPKVGKTGDSQEQGVGDGAGVECDSTQIPSLSGGKAKPKASPTPEPTPLTEDALADLRSIAVIACPFLATEWRPKDDGDLSYEVVEGVFQWLQIFASEALLHGMKEYDLRPCLQFLAMSEVRQKVACLEDMDASWRRRFRAAYKNYIAMAEQKSGDTDNVLAYIERNWERAEQRLRAEHASEHQSESNDDDGSYLESEVEIRDEPEMCHYCHKRPVLASYSTTCKECNETRITISVEDE